MSEVDFGPVREALKEEFESEGESRVPFKLYPMLENEDRDELQQLLHYKGEGAAMEYAEKIEDEERYTEVQNLEGLDSDGFLHPTRPVESASSDEADYNSEGEEQDYDTESFQG